MYPLRLLPRIIEAEEEKKAFWEHQKLYPSNPFNNLERTNIMETTNNWKEFYFDSNLCWGKIESREDWEKVKAMHEGEGVDLLSAKICPHSEIPNNFGFRQEHTGEKTLRDFDNENGNFLTIIKVVNNFYKLNKEFDENLANDFTIRFPLDLSHYTAEEIIEFMWEKCNERAILENQIKINLIEGRLKSHVPSEPGIEEVLYYILEDTATTLDFKKAYRDIMQAIDNIPNFNIRKQDLEYRIRILDGTEERITVEGVE
jgi:hypothetical protein